jgi:hypothetical protein
MQLSSRKLLAIGGSNTRMKAGYIRSLRSGLERGGIELGSLRNISLGANSCLMGLISLETESDIEKPDIVTIEYAVNDYALVASDMSDLWHAAYEGLVRQVRRRWPEALICCIILGREEYRKDLWEIITSGTRRIAEHYPNVIFVDCPTSLHPNLDGEEHHALFADPMHYCPAMQDAAGQLAADMILSAPKGAVAPMPHSLHPESLDPISVVDFSAMDGVTETFQNSAVMAKALKLEAGKTLSVSLPGRLVAISFVSRKDGGSFIIQNGNQAALIHTLHRDIRDEKFAFLPLSAVGNWWKGDNEPSVLSITPVGSQSEADWPIFHVGPATTPGGFVYLLQAIVRAD